MIYDDRICALGEGPLWHPERQQLFWFDILGKRLLTHGAEWRFGDHVSAAGWVDADTLLMASATGLYTFDIPTGRRSLIAPLEAGNAITRSNDGRADPQGGFWIGTMGVRTERYAGAIYRYYRGEVRRLFGPITIPNSIAFAPDGDLAYFTDTFGKRVMRVRLDKHGWPEQPELFLDLRAEGLNPDGSVVDAAGNVWNAQWGASRVACYGPDGTLREVVQIGASQASCPAFGGADLSTLYVTSAADGVKGRHDGMTFAVDVPHKGQAEHRVIL
ncbi:MAG: SMP-30/gluconolactonase/LRE family protein [Pseudomonadota bacterium]